MNTQHRSPAFALVFYIAHLVTLFRGPALFVSLLVSAPLAAQSGTGGMAARNWHQPNGDAGGTSAADVEAVRSQPEQAWSLKSDELLSEPVAWADLLLVITRDSGNRTLRVLRIEDGQEVTKTNLGTGSEAWLAIWQGTVVVVEEQAVRLFTLRQEQLKRGKVLRGDYRTQACLEGALLCVGGEENWIHVVDVKRGKLLDSNKLGTGAPAFADGVVASPGAEKAGSGRPHALYLRRSRIQGSGSKTKLGGGSPLPAGVLTRFPRDEKLRSSYAIAVRPGSQEPTGGELAWFIRSPGKLEAENDVKVYGSLLPAEMLSLISTRPAAWNGELYGFDPEGTLIRQRMNGGYFPVVTLDDLPPGARPAPATVARGVAYLGNWAVELESRRVLWCDPELRAAGSLLPVADGRFVYWTEEHELICCRDSRGAEVTAAASAENAAALPPPTRPGSGDGVVLADGTRYAGSVETDGDDNVIVTPAAGEPRTFPEDRVSLIEQDGEVELLGEQFGVRQAWARALNEDVLELLENQFHAYLKPRLLDDCQRLLEEAAAHGMDSERRRKLTGELANKTQSSASNAERQRAGLAKKEVSAREKVVKEYLVASDWCREEVLPEAATALLADARELGVAEEELLGKATGLIPEEFPFRTSANAAELWLAWTVELLPAGAVFLDPEDDDWEEVKDTIWSKETIGLTTRNLRLFTKATDPKIVGTCLRNGEGAVRVLDSLLGSSGSARFRERLDVRIHANRKAYLEECTPAGTYAMPWSAGYYSPRERVSRFYVPSAGDTGAPIGRELHKTLAHELTHQFLCQRWLTSRSVAVASPDAPGFWIVEGFARFIEDQVVELGRLGGGLNDATVKSIDACARLAEREALIPIKTFVDLTQIEFLELQGKETIDIRLTNTLRPVRLDSLSIFYEEAGSLVFYLMNRCGEEGREKLIEYMRAYYRQESTKRGWKELGFSTSMKLEKELLEFLGSV